MSTPAPTKTPPRLLNHLPALDGLRGLAILLVLAHNFATVQTPASLGGHILELALDIGWIGVQLFFVLSGFLITRILLQTQDSPNYYRAFFGRRVLRIFPLYYGTLLVAFVVLPLLGWGSAALAHDRGGQLWLWLYLSNWTQLLNFSSDVFPHFWSLAIEEQFYLLWPLLVHRRSARQVLRLCFVIAAASLGVRALMLWYAAPPETVYTYTVCRMDALAMGAAVAAWLELPGVAARVAARRKQLIWGTVGAWALGFVVTHGFPRTLPLGQTLGYTWLAVVFAMAVLTVTCQPDERPSGMWDRVLTATPLRTLGKYSYAMYIFHKPLHDLIGRPLLLHFGLLRQPSSVVAVLYVALATLATLGAAVLSFHLFERHFLALKRWFVADAAAPSVTPSPGASTHRL